MTTRSSEYALMTHKRCTACERWLHKSWFQKNTSKADHLQTYCRPCQNAKMRETRARKVQAHG